MVCKQVENHNFFFPLPKVNFTHMPYYRFLNETPALLYVVNKSTVVMRYVTASSLWAFAACGDHHLVWRPESERMNRLHTLFFCCFTHTSMASWRS